MSTSDNARLEQALQILEILKKVYPDAKPLLNYQNCFELLVATILAAQCTDERVNKVTPALFEKCPTPGEMLCLRQSDLEAMIRPTGFFRNKAKNIKELCYALSNEYDGEVPQTIEELVKLPGIGRKTANVIAGHCFGKPAVIVDTHFKRVTARLGLTTQTNPDKLEADVRSFLPEQHQTALSDVINWHGRYRCKARKPECPQCEIRHLCKFKEKTTVSISGEN
ncbi:MAG: endonuclease III [Spirochaetaceae bacterium]|nr:MAG: endonuclease III [Spirochaetaceae bacterium]